MPRTATQKAVDDAYVALGDVLGQVEERHGEAAALALVGRLKATMKAGPSDAVRRAFAQAVASQGIGVVRRRLEQLAEQAQRGRDTEYAADRALRDALEVMEEEQVIAALETITTKATRAGDPLSSVVKFLASGQKKGV